MRKKKAITPRRKRFKSKERLQNAKIEWLPTIKVKNIAKSYSKWYGVDLLCAITELEILGYTFNQSYKDQVRASIENRLERKKEQKAQDDLLIDYDDQFSFIAGYTGNAVPFGITWEEE